MTLQDFLRKTKKYLQVVSSPQNFYFYSKSIFEHHQVSFSQEGEDRILERIFAHKNDGFYVDIGAHHPQRFSNTYKFYLKGWRGINIDAMPGSMDLFQFIRPRDINLEVAIAKESGYFLYYVYNEPALNTFSKETYEQRLQAIGFSQRYHLLEKIEVKAFPLSDVLDNYLPKDQNIDLMSVDVEGLDYDVLTSNNWDKYRPEVVIAEELNLSSIASALNSPIANFLLTKGYKLFAKTVNSLIFKMASESASQGRADESEK